ncbi:MAG: DUF6776 family protein [Thiogranum sp.]
MMARKKIVPPVTPRIVPARPGQQLLRYGLLACAFLLAVWFSYDYGTTQAPAGNTAPVAQQSRESEQRIRDLEQERDALEQRIAALEQRLQQADRTIRTARARTPARQQVQPPKPQPPEPDIPATEPADNTLKLENVRIEQTDADNVFRIAFSVRHAGNSTDRVTGTLWIAVNGFANGVPKRLSFRKLSPDRRLVVKMGFEQQQDVREEIVLPAGFRPRNILIEAKPYGDRYTGTSGKIDWAPLQ